VPTDDVKQALAEGYQALKRVQLRDALAAFHRAIDLSGRAREVVLEVADELKQVGFAATMSADPRWKNPEDGYDMFYRALSYYRHVPGVANGKLAMTMRGLALSASKLGGHEDALEWCDRAMEADPEANERAHICRTRAIALGYLGRDEESLEWADRACQAARDAKPRPKADLISKTERTARQARGLALLRSGRAAEALDYLDDVVLRAWALVEAGRPEEALEVHAEDRPRAAWVQARALEALGRVDEAIARARRGVELLEDSAGKLDTESARVSFLGARDEVSAVLVRLLAGQEKWEEAFAASEAARARAFLHFLLQEPLAYPPSRPSEGGRLQKLREEMDRLEALEKLSSEGGQQLAHVQQEYLTVLRKREKERLARQGVQPVRPFSPSQVARGLGEREALVEYHIAEDGLIAFVIDRRGFRGMRLTCDLGQVLEAASEGWITLAQREERGAGGGFLDWHFGLLGEWLLGELGLRDVDHVVVVPDGALNLVPFPALRVGKKRLIERCAVTVAPSASVFTTLRMKARGDMAPTSCVHVKDPTCTLMNADKEEDALREVFGDSLEVLAGGAATREAVGKAIRGRGAVHFSTHSVFRPERPALSYLDLAEGVKLYAADVAGMPFGDARVVVLSACESGRGDFERANEMVGLPRALLRAGARSVLAALWPVEDHAALASFMRTFYAGLRNGTPAEACRAAQVAAIRAGHPATLWAAFTLIGA